MTQSDPMFRIEPATEHDVPALLRLIHSFAEYVRMAGDVTATEEDLRQTLFDARPKADVLMAHSGSEAIGFAVFFSTYSTFLGRPGLYLEDLFILPAWRNQGLGTQLLATVARIAIDRGCARMEWSALDWNESAVRFYERLGAKAQVESTIFRLTAEPLRRLGSRHSA